MSAAAKDFSGPARRRAGGQAYLRGDLGTWLIRLFLIFMCVLVLMPVLWVLSVSVQPGSSGYSSSLIPSQLSADNYRGIFNAGFWTWTKNSLILSFAASLTQLVINTLGAYAFSRLRFWGQRYGLVALFMIQVFPQVAAISAIFTLIVKVNLFDTLWAVYLVFIAGSAYYMMLLKNYMDSLPRELDESARVDGANSLQIFTLVILPLIRPILFTIFFFGFVALYGEFLFSNLLLQSSDNYTMMVGLQHEVAGQYNTNWSVFSAGAILAGLPILIVFFACQRFLVSGLASGSVKG
ncbi:MAG TPA: sugar ABC transporter permease [Chloroflexota bacterium]|nr:sugar ABC transporter permease [Chloroflexota bacterium]